jgi:(p)ppGpp synthase/HD superfamily hydrolase
MNLRDVRALAKDIHKGQFRRDNETPYFNHLKSVASKLHTDFEKKVAYLHDSIEDTGVPKLCGNY